MNYIPFDPKISSLRLLQAKITPNEGLRANIVSDVSFVVGVFVGLVVRGGSVCGDFGAFSTGGGLKRSYADLTPLIGPLCPPPPKLLEFVKHFFLSQNFLKF